eukprot:16451049-Heterocapsa_arctica.AAC.1
MGQMADAVRHWSREEVHKGQQKKLITARGRAHRTRRGHAAIGVHMDRHRRSGAARLRRHRDELQLLRRQAARQQVCHHGHGPPGPFILPADHARHVG